MKNLLRAFALSLVVTGAVASAHIANASQAPLGAHVSALPVPTCAPGTPGNCGICQMNGSCPVDSK